MNRHTKLLNMSGSLKVLVHRVRNFLMRFSYFLYSSSLPIKTLATDAKMQKIEPCPIFFHEVRKFRRQCINVIDTTRGRIYSSTCDNFRRKLQCNGLECSNHFEIMYTSIQKFWDSTVFKLDALN